MHLHAEMLQDAATGVWEGKLIGSMESLAAGVLLPGQLSGNHSAQPTHHLMKLPCRHPALSLLPASQHADDAQLLCCCKSGVKGSAAHWPVINSIVIKGLTSAQRITTQFESDGLLYAVPREQVSAAELPTSLEQSLAKCMSFSGMLQWFVAPSIAQSRNTMVYVTFMS